MNRVPPINPDQDSIKKKGKITPDSEEFQKIMEIEKVSETDPEERSKQKYKPLAEESYQDTQMPSPYNAKFGDERTAPAKESPEPKKEAAIETDRPKEENKTEKKEDKTEKKEDKGKLYPFEPPKAVKELKKTEVGKPLSPPAKKEPAFSPLQVKPSGTKKKTPVLPQYKEKEKIGQVAESKTPSTLPLQGKTPQFQAPKTEEKTIESEPPRKTKEEEPKIAPTLSLDAIPAKVEAHAASISALAAPYLSPETAFLFQNMVGAIIMVNMKGIQETQVILNSPSFQSSIFFESRIVIQRFPTTAPTSFNITLVGSPQAVELFNQNRQNLLKAFEISGLDFKIQRLDTEIETDKHLIKRKKESANKEKGAKQ